MKLRLSCISCLLGLTALGSQAQVLSTFLAKPPPTTPSDSTFPILPAANFSKPSVTESPAETHAIRSVTRKIDLLIQSHQEPAAVKLAQTALRFYPANAQLLLAYKNALSAANSSMALKASAVEGKQESQADTISPKKKPARPSLKQTTPSTQPGWDIAAQAYKDYDAGQFAVAATGAQQAVQLAPEKKEYRQLLISSLQRDHQFEKANQAVDEAIAKFGNDTMWLTTRDNIRSSLAVKFAEQVYPLLPDHVDQALVLARKAVEFAPLQSQYRVLLIQLLLRDQQYENAENESGKAMQNDPDDATPVILRAYARYRLGKLAASTQDFDSAINLPDLDDTTAANLRLIAIDAALAENDVGRAQNLLNTPLLNAVQDKDLQAEVAARQKIVQRLTKTLATTQTEIAANLPKLSPEFAEPALSWRITPYGSVAELVPGKAAADAGYASARLAYSALATKNYTVAIQHAREAVQNAPGNLSYRELLVSVFVADNQLQPAEQEANQALVIDPHNTSLLLQRGRLLMQEGNNKAAQADFSAALEIGGLDVATEIGALVDAGRTEQARTRLHAALDANELSTLSDLDLAYLCIRAGDDEQAYAAFTRLDHANDLPVRANNDAAFAALHLKLDDDAVRFFKRTIDAVDSQQLEMTQQNLFETRRAVAEIERRFGVIIGLSTRGTGTLPGGSGNGGTVSDSAALGIEAYWRPLEYRGGQYIEVFVRAFDTLRDKQADAATGADSLSGALGARWKPLTDRTLILSIWRQFPLGNAISSDWVVQAAYFDGAGLDLRLDSDNWNSWQVSPTVGRYLLEKQTYGQLNATWGRSYRMDSISDKFVIQPHLVLAGDYNNSLADTYSLGAGAGLSFRYWMREDKYRAPQSYFDLSLEYHERVSGDIRAKGPFLTFTTSY